jgi:ribosomal-protein-alanine N-acetyltransferase
VTAVEIGPMRRSHVREVAAIEQVNQPHPWSPDVFRKELALGDQRHYVVATVGRRVVGYGGLFFAADEAHVTNLSVADDARRQGVATRMMVVLVDAALERGATALTLEVRAGNTAAQGLYRRFGLAPAGVRRAYYQPNDEDALVMWAHDIDAPPYGERLAHLRGTLDGPSPTVPAVEALS